MNDAGKLDRRIELLGVTKTKSSVGQVKTDFAPIATFWGQRLEFRTSDAARAGQRDSYALSKFLIRWRAGIDPAMRIQTGGRTFDIVAVDEPDRRATMILTVEEVRS